MLPFPYAPQERARYTQPVHYYFKSAEWDNGDPHPPYTQPSPLGTADGTPAHQA